MLSVDAALDRVPADHHRLGHDLMQTLAAGDAQLRLHQIDAVTISVTGCSTWMRVFISMK